MDKNNRFRPVERQALKDPGCPGCRTPLTMRRRVKYIEQPMDFAKWDTVFNLLLFLFWFGVWNADDRDQVFNPYVKALSRVSGATVKFLQPVLTGLGPRTISLTALIFLIVFRGVAVPAGTGWSLSLGFEQGAADTARTLNSIGFSALSFSIFFFKLWGLCLIYAHGQSSVHPVRTLQQLGEPLNRARAEFRPWLLLGCGTAIGWLIHVLAGTPAASLPKLIVSALAGWVSVLPVLVSAVWALVIGSWVAMFTAAGGVSAFCHDWLNVFLGPLRRHPIRIGTFDISPIVLVIALDVITRLLMGVLSYSYQALP